MIVAGPAIRVKRRRSSDPVEALLISCSKRKRSDDIVYRLVENAPKPPPDQAELQVSLDATEGNHRVYHVKRHRDEATKKSESIAEEAITSAGHCLEPEPDNDPARVIKAMVDEEPNEEMEDYVYDYYYRDRATNSTTLPQAVGYIEFDDPDDVKFLMDDIESSDDSYHFVDDEDSNAEDFYRNDYPDSDLSEEPENGWMFSDDEEEEDYGGDLGDFSDEGYYEYIQSQLRQTSLHDDESQ